MAGGDRVEDMDLVLAMGAEEEPDTAEEPDLEEPDLEEPDLAMGEEEEPDTAEELAMAEEGPDVAGEPTPMGNDLEGREGKMPGIPKGQGRTPAFRSSCPGAALSAWPSTAAKYLGCYTQPW